VRVWCAGGPRAVRGCDEGRGEHPPKSYPQGPGVPVHNSSARKGCYGQIGMKTSKVFATRSVLFRHGNSPPSHFCVRQPRSNECLLHVWPEISGVGGIPRNDLLHNPQPHTGPCGKYGGGVGRAVDKSVDNSPRCARDSPPRASIAPVPRPLPAPSPSPQLPLPDGEMAGRAVAGRPRGHGRRLRSYGYEKPQKSI
jgi:hypothetical protein